MAPIRAEMRIAATPESLGDLTAFAKEVLKATDVSLAVDDIVNVTYTFNLCLDDRSPSCSGMLSLLKYLQSHPTSLILEEKIKDALFSHMERAVKQATAWQEMVERIFRDYATVLMRQEQAHKKANNKVSIE